MLGMESFNVLLIFYRKNFLVYYFFVKYMYILIKSYRYLNRKYMYQSIDLKVVCVLFLFICCLFFVGQRLLVNIFGSVVDFLLELRLLLYIRGWGYINLSFRLLFEVEVRFIGEIILVIGMLVIGLWLDCKEE